jgi:3-oxoacyl-[acyl-carrier-protein] synthase II
LKHRVAITGIGAITPIGIGVEELWQGVRAGTSAVRTIARFDASMLSSQVAAEIEFDPLQYMSPKRARRLDRFSTVRLVSAQMALADAGITADELAQTGAGVYVGSALGGVAFGESEHEAFVRNGPQHVNPLIALSVFGGAASSNIAIEFGLHGPSLGNGTPVPPD